MAVTSTDEILKSIPIRVGVPIDCQPEPYRSKLKSFDDQWKTTHPDEPTSYTHNIELNSPIECKIPVEYGSIQKIWGTLEYNVDPTNQLVKSVNFCPTCGEIDIPLLLDLINKLYDCKSNDEFCKIFGISNFEDKAVNFIKLVFPLEFDDPYLKNMEYTLSKRCKRVRFDYCLMNGLHVTLQLPTGYEFVFQVIACNRQTQPPTRIVSRTINIPAQ